MPYLQEAFVYTRHLGRPQQVRIGDVVQEEQRESVANSGTILDVGHAGTPGALQAAEPASCRSSQDVGLDSVMNIIDHDSVSDNRGIA